MLKIFKQLSSIGLALLLLVGVSVGTISAAQQSDVCTGVVKDSSGEGLIGAAVFVVGTNNGTTTDLDGNFSLRGVKVGDTIQIAILGYQTKELVWNGSVLDIVLEDDAMLLENAVVTALGITREQKTLGYALQEVEGDALLQAHETNIANALTGKVSGVQILKSSNGPAGSSKILLRGSNSLTGTNQPLIVVDGMPIDNFTGSDNNDFWNPGTDMGNGLSDINAEDIESMTVLKGASAAALYGSRAGNGVILITTKKGARNDGLGITVSFTASTEGLFMIPDRQKTYGQGSAGIVDPTSSYNWGPKITGQSYTAWDGSTQTMKYYDNVKNFFDTGLNLTESISLSQQYGKTAVYISATQMNDSSMIPGATYDRTNLMSRINTTFGKNDNWIVDAKVQYIKSKAKNRPISGSNTNNYFYNILTMPISIDIRDFKQATDPSDGTMYWWEKGSSLNPYWSKDYNTNKDTRDRVIMNASVKYKFTDWLSAEIKAGSDLYFTESETKLYAGSPNSDYGRYSFGEEKFYENNYSFLVTAQKDNVFGKWGGMINFGGNLMQRKNTGLSSSISQLAIADLFWLSNSTNDNRSVSQTYSHRKTNSLYGTLSINYDNWVFLEGTFRNDWSSTLSKANRSFFYPSVSLSWVISDMVNKTGGYMPRWFTFAKARASFAQVGNDLEPYQLYNTYSIGTISYTGGYNTSVSSTLYDDSVRSELISSWEAGAEVHFFDNRLGVDISWYKTNARRQLISLPLNSLSGYSSKMINAGDIQNTGLEIMLNATPITNSNFTWDSNVNFSLNRNKIIELTDGVDQYSLGGYDNLHIYAIAGGNYGEIWGTTFLRVTDESSPYYGELLLSDGGLPQQDSNVTKIGDQQADFLLGWTNTFTYKGFSLSFLIDGRFGGEIYSGTNSLLQKNGVAGVTVVNGSRDSFVVDGVIADGNGGYSKSTIEVTPESYWNAIGTGNLGISEANLYDATNIRLRTLSLNYNFPRKMLEKTPIQSLKLGVSCNNVCMIVSHLNGVDPESVYATNTNATGFEYASSPTSRTFTFNVSIGF